MILMVPKDETMYPTLGPQVCDFIERNMVYGPGDLRGQPVVLDDEWRALIYRMYEVFPQGHPQAGRRRFKRCGLSLPKGYAKTERAAMIAICELHPEGPVRCVGWTPDGEPIGGPVTDPYIPLVATSQEQSDELIFTAMRVIIELSPLRDDFDVGLERILRKKGDGKAEALSSSPNARDGARTTFSVMDETHRMTMQRQRHSHTVMLTNIPKRRGADGWMLEVTTAPEPGAGSVAEATMNYARSIEQGQRTDAVLFFFHRQAGDEHDFTTVEGRRAGVVEASGASAAWRDIDGIVALWDDPGADVAYLERVYGNRLVKGATQAFNVLRWKELAKPRAIPTGALITVGFDGSRTHDSTAIVCTDVETNYQWLAKVWERPATAPIDWKVPGLEVDAEIRRIFDEYDVWRMYADPPYWQDWVAKWAGDPELGTRAGEPRVIEWYTNRRRQMAAALESFTTAIKDGGLSHDGSAAFERHIGNARRADIPGQFDEEGKPIYLIQKDRPDSPHKMDIAMAAVLSHEARTDAIAAGALAEKPSVYEERGVLVL
jgi:phage terminase large subunit-like protein